MLDQPSSFGRVVSLANLGSTDGYIIYDESIQEAKRLARHESLSSKPVYHLVQDLAESHRKALIPVLASAPLPEVARAGGFPDWLGILGIALSLVQPNEPVTESWCRQFHEMGEASHFWIECLYPNSGKLLSLDHLEMAETERLGSSESDLP